MKKHSGFRGSLLLFFDGEAAAINALRVFLQRQCFFTSEDAAARLFRAASISSSLGGVSEATR